jgi:hypothetical protein
MSQANVEKVRRGFAEYNRGDIEGALQEWDALEAAGLSE